MKKLIVIALMCALPQISLANRLVNDMQTCQGLIDFLNKKLENPPAKYPSSDVKKVIKGINGYNKYIQTSIVTPGLLKAVGNNKSQADALQNQVNTYRQSVVKQYESRYPTNQLFSDHAFALNNCAKKAVPTGQALEDLKVALPLIIELAKKN